LRAKRKPGSEGKCEGMNLTLPRELSLWEFGVSVDSRIFKERLQGSKPNGLNNSLYHWKAIKTQMSKMGSHDPFRHLEYKLWPKEKLRVKLAI